MSELNARGVEMPVLAKPPYGDVCSISHTPLTAFFHYYYR